MAVMDEFREQRESIKNGTPKEKFAYFLDYYKWYVIGIAAVVIFATSFIYNYVTKTESVLSGVLLNTYIDDLNAKEALISTFMEEQNIDTSEYHVDLNTSYSYSTDTSGNSAQMNISVLQAITAQGGNSMLDFMTGDTATVVDFAYRGWFADLRTILTEEQIEKYEPYFLYIDQAVLKEIEKVSEEMGDITEIERPDPTNPDAMKEPIPMFIDISKCEKITDLYTYDMDRILFAAFTNTQHQEMVQEFVDFIHN